MTRDSVTVFVFVGFIFQQTGEVFIEWEHELEYNLESKVLRYLVNKEETAIVLNMTKPYIEGIRI